MKWLWGRTQESKEVVEFKTSLENSVKPDPKLPELAKGEQWTTEIWVAQWKTRNWRDTKEEKEYFPTKELAEKFAELIINAMKLIRLDESDEDCRVYKLR